MQPDRSTEKRIRLTGRVILAGRALSGVGQADFALAAGIGVEKLGYLEASGSAWLPPGPEIEAIAGALERYGVTVFDESDGFGAGVRLKFTRADAQQLARLEGEGGIAASDDAP